MKIPSSLRIRAHTYQVRLTSEIDGCGSVDVGKNLIRINSKHSPDQQASALIHEILGALKTTMHLKQHELLDSLSEQLFQVLYDNHMLV